MLLTKQNKTKQNKKNEWKWCCKQQLTGTSQGKRSIREVWINFSLLKWIFIHYWRNVCHSKGIIIIIVFVVHHHHHHHHIIINFFKNYNLRSTNCLSISLGQNSAHNVLFSALESSSFSSIWKGRNESTLAPVMVGCCCTKHHHCHQRKWYAAHRQ